MGRLTPASPRSVLCVNTGSSSLKVAQYRVDGDGSPVPLATVEAGGIGGAAPRLVATLASGVALHDGPIEIGDHDDALALVLDRLAGNDLPEPAAVGHRVVHGGPHLVEHAVVDADVLARLQGAACFAPLHVPVALSAIESAGRAFPQATQVVCLDTAFHRTLPEVARRLPLPAWVDDAGIRRYGFHGLSCEHVVHRLGPARLGRAIVAHLGAGASVTAIRDGRSVDTTMGLTPTGGLVMGTRAGDLDPGVLVHLGREHHLTIDAIDRLVNHEAGLLGLSGRSADMRELAAAEQTDPAAAGAIDAFCASVRKAIGALVTVLDGIDTIVFTGGIGEHDHAVRARIGDGLAHLGVRLDDARNRSGGADGEIGAPGSPVAVHAVRADENAVIAHHTIRLAADPAR